MTYGIERRFDDRSRHVLATECIVAFCDAAIVVGDRAHEPIDVDARIARERRQIVRLLKPFVDAEGFAHLLAAPAADAGRCRGEHLFIEHDPVPQIRLRKQRLFARIDALLVFTDEALATRVDENLPGQALLRNHDEAREEATRDRKSVV